MSWVRLALPACLMLWQASSFGAGSSRPAMLTSVTGTVDVKGAGQSGWKRAGLMALLNVGDALRTGKASTATVVYFSDGHREKLLAETTASVQQSVLSSASRRLVVPKGGREPAAGAKCVVVLQGGVKLSASGASEAGRPGAFGVRQLPTLRLLSPLGPKIRSASPAFAWAALSGAQAYRFELRDASGRILLSKELPGTRVTYAGTLQPRVLYRWSVEAFVGTQSLGAQRAGFALLTPTSLEKVRAGEAALKPMAASDPRDTTAPILLSRLYQEYGLSSEAISQLERAAALCPDEPALLDELGSLYHLVGWEGEAQRQFQRAQELRLPAAPGSGQLP